MSSIIRDGDTFHGISVFGRGVFTNDEDGLTWTYAGQCRDGYACGLGVTTWSNGWSDYAEHGPDGWFDGRNLGRWDIGHTNYHLYARGKSKEYAIVFADGRCKYNGEACAPDDPRLLALIAQVAPVEVRLAAPATHPPSARHSYPSNRPMDQPARFVPAGAGEGHGHRGAPPRRTPSLVAVRHSPTAAALYRGIISPRAFLPGFAVSESRSGLAGRGSRGQPATALGGARALRPPSSAGYSRGTEEAVTGCSRSTHRVH
jgi:hypothetical protein